MEDRFYLRIETELTILNLTSSTAFKSLPKSKLCSIDAETVVCEVPAKQCSEHHSLLVSIWVKPQDGREKSEICFTARVEQILPLKNGLEKVTFSLVQYEQRDWTQFQEIFAARQNAIDQFVEVVRGTPIRLGENLVRKQREADALRQYFSQNSILLLEPSDCVLAELERMLVGLGAVRSRIHSAQNLPAAVELLKKERPAVILAEYQLGRGSGIDLMGHLKQIETTGRPVFFLLSENSSQAAVARSAQEDVDGYLIKPLHPDSFRRALTKAALERLSPTHYLSEIRTGEARLGAGDLVKAEAHFQAALHLDTKPALACYFLGELNMMKRDLAMAEECFKKGLGFNRLHYRCMDGRFRVAMSGKRFDEAYDIANRISHFFPMGANRLSEMLKLAVLNGRYEDVERYYQNFCRLTERDRNLVNHVCAGLVVCGKHYLRTKNRARALEVLEKAAVTGFERIKILSEVVQTLIDHRLLNEAQSFLNRFPEEKRGSVEFLELDFQILSRGTDVKATLNYGQELIVSGKATERIFLSLIQTSIEAQDHFKARELRAEALKRFPASKVRWESAA